jgi:hypothetical protein
MPLNRLSLQAMARLADDIDAVRAAMAILEDRGLVALADLTPGRHMAITLVREMPEIAHQIDPLPADMTIAQRNFEAMYGVRGHIQADFRAEAAPVPLQDPDPDKYARAAGLVDNEGIEVAPEATPITAEAPPAGDTGESAATPEPAVTGAGEAEADAADPAPQPVWPARWTEDETARLIEIMADRMERRGDGMRPAAEIAAEILGRPVEGTLYKARSIVERIEAARRLLVAQVLDRLAPAGASTEPGGENQPVPEGLPEAAPEAMPGADALTPTGELHRHLAKVKRDKLWTIERDHDLMHFSRLGWPAGDIALEIKVPVAEIKPRFAVLTASRKFKVVDVLAALAATLDAQAA